MNNVNMGFILTIIAGLSTMLGTIFIFIKKKSENIIIASLSFAAGVMLTVSITDLIPESYVLLTSLFAKFPAVIYMLIFVVCGVLFSMLIDKYIPTKNNNSNLYQVSIISMLAIIIHNVPEGIATFMATNSNVMLGISLAIAIALHNIPEGISISIPIYYATNSKFKALFYTFISGISEPFGALLTYLFLSNFINDRIMGFLFGVIAGIMIHISLYELLPTAKSYQKRGVVYLFFMIGVLFMLVNHFLF